MKRCTCCGEKQDSDSFYKNSRTKDGRGSQCKRCDRTGKKLRRVEKKQRLIEAFGGKCCLCGYSKCIGALDFHHEGNESKEFTIADFLTRKFSNLMREARKCKLLCANCHRELHYLEVESYGGKRRKATEENVDTISPR